MICGRPIPLRCIILTFQQRFVHYILTVIDVLNKYAWAVPFKSKSESEMAKMKRYH